MLVTLTVQNLAIIDNLSVDFSEGMTVLTGETGAGKSLIIDAIDLLFGRRASTDLIRYGETKAIIEGVFSETPPAAKNLLGESEDDYLVLRREIHANGKSLCKINNITVTLAQLSAVADELGDIHTQFDTQGLFNRKNYLGFLDDRAVEEDLEEYRRRLKTFRALDGKHRELTEKSQTDARQLEFLKYQQAELSKARLSPEEEEELKSRAAYLTNFEEINLNIKGFAGIYDEANVLDNVYRSLEYLDKLSSFDKKYADYKRRLEELYYSLEDLVDEVSRDAKEFEFDEGELDRINERLGLYSDLKRKYKLSTAEIIALHDKISEEIDAIENYDYRLAALEKELAGAREAVLETANAIREKRIALARRLEEEIKAGLEDLQLKNTVFKIAFNDISELKFYENGIDEIDFLITFNPGEPLRPLSKVASGGELSRFMLALKAILFTKINLQTIVFDEIDAGISGSVAYSIAAKIKQISKQAQVLCVTHLPQVAAAADHHISVTKRVTGDRTSTEITRLDYSGRVNEIGEMISNGAATLASKALAAELLDGKNVV
ncbi:MAG: DNA repair protein RecN [Bacilli bacterium]|jgi:DNA repair protein RecN (Recombination protein N)|nr:DNA repair protein RecN [Acholeplasmataceae bacterium]